jgi:predicted phosphodiesterase
MPDQTNILSWLHIGDLHLTRAEEENHHDFLRLVALIQELDPDSLDFVLLPGDNADDGTPEQFALVHEAVAGVKMPIHILPGDHDFKPRSLRAFYDVLQAERLPKAMTMHGHRCLFLDVVSAGTGGPDFRLDEAQLDWAEHELDAAEAAGQGAVIFMHTYPADLRDGAPRLGELLDRPHVMCVDMGHTHYNELANDGRTIFMATRSTGQIEEGPAGFSVAAIDGFNVSWRFKTLEQAWPLVLITSPADRRLVTNMNPGAPAPFTVRAKVIGEVPIAAVALSTDGSSWAPMAPVPGISSVWQGTAPQAERIVVRARDTSGRVDEDAVQPAGPAWLPPERRRADGSDADRIGAWPEKFVFDTQLGPNRNGRKW